MQLRAVDDITNQYRHIYLQPHFDDAILSSGGTIALQVATGQKALVVTVFGGVPPADAAYSSFAMQALQRDGLGSDVAAATAKRRAEDQSAVESLGADVLWLDFLDAPFRGAPAYYQDEQALFGNVSQGDLSLDEQIATAMLKMHERAPLAVFYAPLGAGHHVDHQIVCSAGDRLAQRKLNIKFYEDFPYVARKGAGALEARQKELGIPMEPELVEISNQPARLKEDALLHYSSQIPVLFSSEDKMRQLLKDYSGGIRRTYPGIQIERFWTW